MRHLSVIHFDDDVFELERVKRSLEGDGLEAKFTVQSAKSREEFQQHLADFSFDVAILDIYDQQESDTGMDLVRIVKKQDPRIVIIMRSSLDDPKTILTSFSLGANDFVSKNSETGEFRLRVLRAVDIFQSTTHTSTATKAPSVSQNIVGSTMQKIRERMPRIIESAISSVFVSGESGTGKEVVASLFQECVAAGTPFVSVNCGAIAASVLESELFGYVKGAFTGATRDKMGLIEAANGGWIFLDEVTTLSPAGQVALLRVLENGEVLRVGSNKPQEVNVRVISATNEDVPAKISAGEYRGDLWQRLKETVIELPPLSERKEEIPDLIQHFCRVMHGGPYRITAPTVAILCEYDWTGGNIRELRNCLRAMTEYQTDGILTPMSIPKEVLKGLDDILEGDESEGNAYPSEPGDQRGSIQIPIDYSVNNRFEDICDATLLQLILGKVAFHGKISVRQMSTSIGMPRSTLSNKLKTLVANSQLPAEQLGKLETWLRS